MTNTQQEGTTEHGPWAVLVGKLSDQAGMVEVVRHGKADLYPLAPREPFQFFSKPVAIADADAYLARTPFGGCRSVAQLVAQQPGLLYTFSGDFDVDAAWLVGKCVVSEVEAPQSRNWDMVVATCRSVQGNEAQAFSTTIHLLHDHPRLTSTMIEEYEGATYLGEDGGDYIHNARDYAKDLLYDLWALLESGVAYLDAAKVTTIDGVVHYE
jgi:hypothetical protein